MRTSTPRTEAAWAASFSPETPGFNMRDLASTLERELHESRNAERLARVQLATERARLDWLLSYDGVDWILSAHKNRKLFEGESDNRALLESAMKEGAK